MKELGQRKARPALGTEKCASGRKGEGTRLQNNQGPDLTRPGHPSQRLWLLLEGFNGGQIRIFVR